MPIRRWRHVTGCATREDSPEKLRRHQSQKIAGLQDGLRNQDRQRGVQKAEPAAHGNDDRNEKQKRYNQQQNSNSEHDARDEAHDR